MCMYIYTFVCIHMDPERALVDAYEYTRMCTDKYMFIHTNTYECVQTNT